ncbi:unnamed protein product [Coffea canephora]|uniref:Uncharacterized protein n=1 Tax=Coffea canephora TaxID=49390 RepID=A0A068TZQ4_COFCA|nr:unnamed protein product [Coffea canephora]
MALEWIVLGCVAAAEAAMMVLLLTILSADQLTWPSNIHKKEPPKVISDDGLVLFVLAVGYLLKV